MKKLFKKINDVTDQIREAEIELENIKGWPAAVCRVGEKERQIDKHVHWLNELREAKLKYLLELSELVNGEIAIFQGHAQAS